jgi:hypothetical protein
MCNDLLYIHSRYIYYEDVQLTADNVLPVLFAAKKYMMDNLVVRCLCFLKDNIREDNVCTILNHCVLYDEKELVGKCLKFIGPRTKHILVSEGFLNLSKSALKHLLEFDRLVVDSECEVLEACKAWAVRCLESLLDDGSSSEAEYEPEQDHEVRKTLGDSLYQIRFATMTVDEFAKSVGASRILTDEESRLIFCHLSTWQYHEELKEMGFNISPRSTTYEYCRRFWKVGGGWNYERDFPDAISVSVDRPIWMLGVSVYGGESKGDVHDYIMELYDGTKYQWVSRCEGVLETDGTDNPIPILNTNPPHRLEPGAVHTIKIRMSGPKSYFGEGGVRTVRCDGVKFTFTTSSESMNETVVAGGQIPEIIFRRV